MMESPVIVFVVATGVLWLSAGLGAWLGKWRHKLGEDERQDFSVILAATLTLLGLVIGFTFSMAVTRYDQRKNYEEEEANAIGTEYLRMTLLPAADAAKARALLVSYLEQRIKFYVTTDDRRIAQINADTSRLKSELWSTVRAAAASQPTPTMALAVAGLNDVLNSQGYTEAAWWNRIPAAAWAMMAVIATCCNLLFGYTTRHVGRNSRLFLVLPLIVSVSFFLIADLDSPRHGVIQVRPQNLISLAQSIV